MSYRDRALDALKKYFGFDAFREGQDEVIDEVLSGANALVVMPTGGGKSLCYQLPALLRDGVTVVVSPLIALMKDQVDALDLRGIPATFINSSIDFKEQTARIRGLKRGAYKLVYIAPERFRNDRFVSALAETNVSLLAVDEAHCISEWGHDFRPDYRRLGEASKRLGVPQIVALTATATPEVRADIAQQLDLGDARHFIAGFDRPNLALRVYHTARDRDKQRIMVQIVRESTGAGIVYAATRKGVETVTARLNDSGLKALAYHAGLDERSRTRAQEAFMAGELNAIVATNAFGMGIDKPDIRFVIHYHIPGSIEAYYQEIGRAGRDGYPAHCTLLFNYADTRFQQFFIEGSYPPPETIMEVYRAVSTLGAGRHEVTNRELAARVGLKNEMAVSSALTILERAGHVERGSSSDPYSSIEFLAPIADEAVFDGLGSHSSRVLTALAGVPLPRPGTMRQVGLADLSAGSELSVAQVRRALDQLEGRGIIRHRPVFQERGIRLLDDGPVRALRIDRSDLARRAAAEQRKLRRMIDFAYHRGCLRGFILAYFGDRRGAVTCGICSGCTGETAPKSRPGSPSTDGGTLRMRGSRSRQELDEFIRESAPTGDALRDHLRESRAARKSQEDREIRVGPDSESTPPPAPLDEERTLVLRKILSCVARMRERYGKTMVAAVLRGSRSKKVLEQSLDELSTYGILGEMSQDEIVAWCDALADEGLLAVTAGAYPTLSLTKAGRDVMSGRVHPKIDLDRHGIAPIAAPAPKAKPTSRTPPTESEADGDDRRTVDVTFALFRAGLSIDAIAERRSLTTITVEGHIADLIESGRIDDLSKLVGAERYRAIAKVANEAGLEKLKPIFEAFGKKVPYREIRFVVADLKRKLSLG